MQLAAVRDQGNQPMRMLAYILAIICVIAAVMYYTMQAGSLPTFTHALAAAIAAVVLFLIGFSLGRARR